MSLVKHYPHLSSVKFFYLCVFSVKHETYIHLKKKVTKTIDGLMMDFLALAF